MVTVGLLVRLVAKPGKEAEVTSFLEGGLALVQEEPATIAWFAIRLGPSEFGIFDAFPDDAGRQAHLGRPGGARLGARGPRVAGPPAGDRAGRRLGGQAAWVAAARSCAQHEHKATNRSSRVSWDEDNHLGALRLYGR